MSRIALLIEASKSKKHGDLPGAVEDVASYASFLASDFGGAWKDDEIRVLNNPSKDLVNAWLKVAKNADYAFITFSGHGYHAVGKGINETRLLINDDQEMAVSELNPGNPRVLIIPDACRKVTPVTMEKSARSIQASLTEAARFLKPNRQRCRELFDKGITNAELGSIYMYSCDLNEAAGDTNSFSRMLVGVGEAWAERRDAGTLASNYAFAGAAEATTKKNPQQHPKMDAGRRINHFPFAVLAY
jgi:hypothetical protein